MDPIVEKNNVSKLKDEYPHLKVMIAVGGWEDGSLKYSNMAANATRRSRFVNKTVDFLKYVYIMYILYPVYLPFDFSQET